MNISNENRYDFNFSSVLNVIKSSGIGLRWIFAREYETWSTIYGKLNQVQYYYCSKYHIPWGQYCWPYNVNLNKGLTNSRTRCDLDGYICLKYRIKLYNSYGTWFFCLLSDLILKKQYCKEEDGRILTLKVRSIIMFGSLPSFQSDKKQSIYYENILRILADDFM